MLVMILTNLGSSCLLGSFPIYIYNYVDSRSPYDIRLVSTIVTERDFIVESNFLAGKSGRST
jgi:hypothetical protein